MLNSFDAVCNEIPEQPFLEVSVLSVDMFKHGKRVCTICIPATNKEAAIEYFKTLCEAESYYGIQYRVKTDEDKEAMKALL